MGSHPVPNNVYVAPPVGVPTTYTITANPDIVGAFTPVSASVTVTSLPDVTNPVISVSNDSQHVTLTLVSGTDSLAEANANAGSLDDGVPYSVDFRYTVCWASSCMTSPWASTITNTAWGTTDPQDWADADPPHGSWTTWFGGGGMFPGDVSVSVETSTLPPNILLYPQIGVQLSNNSSLAQEYQSELCQNMAFNGVGAPGGVYAPTNAGECWQVTSPAVMRIAMAGYFNTPVFAPAGPPPPPPAYDAQYVSTNIPPTFNPSQNIGVGTDGNPLEITVRNTGGSTWHANGATTAVSESGSCSASLLPSDTYVCPSASAAAGSQCTVNVENWGSDFSLQHIPGSFTPGTDPAQYANPTQYICTVGAVSCSNNTPSCDVSKAVCENTGSCVAASPGGLVGTCTDVTTCLNPVSSGGCAAFSGSTFWSFAGACNGTWTSTDNLAVAGNADTAPLQDAQFKLNTLTAPAASGNYTDTWQIYDPGQLSGGTTFGHQMPIPLTVQSTSYTCGAGVCAATGTAGAPSCATGCSVPPATLKATCTPSSIPANSTSQCTLKLGGVAQTNATWAISGSAGGVIDATGLYSPSTPGTESRLAPCLTALRIGDDYRDAGDGHGHDHGSFLRMLITHRSRFRRIMGSFGKCYK